VNWMRLKWSDSIWAMVEIMSVLARPGTPSRMQCPWQKQGEQHLLDDLALADDGPARGAGSWRW